MQLKTASQPVRDCAAMTPETALQRALYRAAHLGLGLTLDIAESRCDTLGRDGVLEQVMPTDLIVRLEQEAEGPGVMALDLDLVSALVEVQTLGTVMNNPAAARAVTSTDAAVAMPLIDGTLSGFESLTADENSMAPGFHFGAWVRDPGLLAAQLPDGLYETFGLSVSIGAGERIGRLFLALPVPPAPAPAAPEPAASEGRDSLSHEILEASARLDVILHRLEMPLGAIGALKPGDVLTLPVRALSEVTLHAGERKSVAVGVLGQLSGQRAVCLKNINGARAKSVNSPAEQAQAMSEVDLADPGLLSGAAPTPELPAAAPAEVITENADDILRDLGLSEGVPANKTLTDPVNVPALPVATAPGKPLAEG